MLEAFPFQQMITTVLAGSGECAEVQWTLLGMSMPTWMVGIFVVMTLLSLKLLFLKERSYFSGNFGR
jgi:disulfide bond formation protein DsbB